MNNSQKFLKMISGFLEAGILTSQDLKKEYENVFKPFYRVDKSRSLNRSGVGLGLSISQDIVKSHGGNISLSESKFKGLAVKVSLPF